MALNLTHQIGALAGASISTTDTNSSSVESVNASPKWRSSTPSLTCKIQRPDAIDGLSPPLSPCRSPLRVDPARSVSGVPGVRDGDGISGFGAPGEGCAE
ncbi:hypothetical protein Prudu_000390 [Prunus dulcis]|uniref:Uncharacterized protein n=1 Tax=Prunus dulcis TaxID=3755 RepID=A0A4Y1QLA3_PRUDU|nr:hypothetical protein Prudu_000390 [Prunus dulcis]